MTPTSARDLTVDSQHSNQDEPPSARRPRAGPDAPPRLTLPDGATAELRGRALELLDAEGRLLVRYADGRAEIAAPAGDLVLSAPAGRVVVQSAADIDLRAARDITARADRRWQVEVGPDSTSPRLSVGPRATEVRADRLSIEADQSRLVTRSAAVLARVVTTTAEQIVERADTIERTATRMADKARDVFQEVADLCQSRVGRLRAIVRDTYSVRTRRTEMVSTDDTSIDGNRVLLG